MEGSGYRLAEKEWIDILPQYTTPINYCEIGVFCGHNVVSFAKTFIKNEESKIYAIDPWLDYKDCPNGHYGNHNENYIAFKNNMNKFNLTKSVVECRGFSSVELNSFSDNFFDIIFVDGNHHEPYYEIDFELSRKKVKEGGIIIIDDTQHPPIRDKCLEIFEVKYKDEFSVIVKKEGQYFYKKQSLI